MKNHANRITVIPNWLRPPLEAVIKPGLIMKGYSAFHSYSNRRPFFKFR